MKRSFRGYGALGQSLPIVQHHQTHNPSAVTCQRNVGKHIGILTNQVAGRNCHILNLIAAPALQFHIFPDAYVKVTRRPVPAILIGGFAHHCIFFRKLHRICCDKTITLCIKRIETNFQYIVALLQQALHLFSILLEHIVRMHNLHAIEPNVGISIQTIENQIDILFMPDAIRNIESKRIVPCVLRNPL